MPPSALRQSDLFADAPYESDIWSERLLAAFADANLNSGFLPLAEQAIEACPGDAIILLLAATAALLDGRPERALVFLKRFSKRASAPAGHLLHALALNQVNKRAAARALLESKGLTSRWAAVRAFPGGSNRLPWLIRQLDSILDRAARLPGTRSAVRPKVKPRRRRRLARRLVRAKRRSLRPSRSHPRRRPCRASTSTFHSRSSSTWRRCCRPWRATRSRTAAGSACASGSPISAWRRASTSSCACRISTGVEPLLHQIETVRKVLKQFRGRVLLADEVGLGKTIEAGMVLKEYALRGMAERTLVLTPASLVGQWREELETKFGLAFATTYDPLLRDEPQAFWAQDRIVASIATARRREHAERLVERQFDLVIVDEAHHLRDRSSQSWKLVDALNKRFLLLLSATPVQNDLIELYNLLTLLKPGIFKTLKEFRLAYMTPGKPRQPANSERLRALMRDAMIRNTRAVVALKLPRRHATTIKVDGGPGEAEAYATSRRLRGGWRREGEARRERLVLHHLLSAARLIAQGRCSGRSLGSRRETPGDPVWAELANRWAAIETGGKEAALIDLVRRNPTEKKLVFVHSRETLAHLGDRLEERRRFARALRRQSQRTGEGRGDRRVSRACERPAVHAVGRRRAQHPVLQHVDQFRRALESDGDRAAHRPHRPHRPEPRGVRLQSGHARHLGGAVVGAAR